MERMMNMSAWEEIMSKCPFMKELIENKIAEEISKVKQGNESLNARIDEIESQVSAVSAFIPEVAE